MFQVIRLLQSWPSLLLLALVALLPVYGSFMPYIEGSLWPVASRATILSVVPKGNGVDISYTYTKFRLCELVGYSARIGGIDTLMVPIGEPLGLSINGLGPEAPRQWHLVAPDLDGAEIWVLHRCNPLWLTATKIYP